MRDRPIAGCQKLKKQKERKLERFVLVGKKKGSREILPHLPWFDYELCLVVKGANRKCTGGGGADNDSVRY